MINIREIISGDFIRGKGIEIGALENPWPVNPSTQVIYVDNKKPETLVSAYHLESSAKLHRVDRIDDGIELFTFEPGSLDFILASHFLEHTPSPLSTIDNHLNVLKPGGIVAYALPNRHNPIDKKRSTIFDYGHLLEDYVHGPNLREHHREYLSAVDGVTDHKQQELIYRERMSQGLDIHYHCFSAQEWLSVFERSSRGFDFQIEFFRDNDLECFFVLRKAS